MRPNRTSHFSASLSFLLAAASSLFPLTAGSQTCRGTPDVGCTSPGAQCSAPSIPKGHCTTPPGFPRGERQCVCEGPPPTPPPPVVLNPRYVIGALVYAPPGCNSPTAGTPCAQPGLVDYSSASSMGSKVTIADSFKSTAKLTLDWGNPAVVGGEGSFAWSHTTGQSQSAALTKTGSLEIKVPGNGDGINHDQDMFILLLNPTLTLTMDSDKNIYWQPGFSGDAAERYEVYVGELRNPATMRPAVASVLKGLGFTAADYKTIRCKDPFSGPGVTGPGGAVPDPCEWVAYDLASGGAAGLDPNRFRLTTYILPYEPPQHPLDLCPSITATIKNDYATENDQSTQDETTVSFQQGGGLSSLWSLKLEGSMTWTSSETDATTTDATQSASLTLVCPSSGYTGPTEFQVYVDDLYGTFVFVPFNPLTMEITQHGTVTGSNGKPIAGEPVSLEYGGRTYHTFTSARGAYRFIRLKQPALASSQKGTLTVRGQKRVVTIGSQGAGAIRLQ
jgi:hypothetical protein